LRPLSHAHERAGAAAQAVERLAQDGIGEDTLFDLMRRAYPYATLARDEYMDVVRALADGFTTRRGHRAAYVHRDAVNGLLRGRRGARLTALTSGGAIPTSEKWHPWCVPRRVRGTGRV